MAGYGSDDGAGGFAEWMEANGYTTTADDNLTVAQLRQRASDYIDGLYGARFRGEPTGGIDQERAWPRIGAMAWKTPLATDAIPRNVIIASYHAALQEALRPGSLAISAVNSGALKRKKIDTIEKEYFEGSGNAVTDNTLRLSAVEGLLAPFLIPETASACLGLWAVG